MDKFDSILRLTRMKNEREPNDAWMGNKCTVRAEDVDSVSSRKTTRGGSDFTAQVVMYNCTVSLAIDYIIYGLAWPDRYFSFNSSNDSFLVASQRALSTEQEYFVAILIKTNNRRFITNEVARMA